MSTAERSVLHVLPHPGGGGETYVDLLEDMPGYRFDRRYLAADAKAGPVGVARGLAAVTRAVGRDDLLHVHGEVAAGLCLPLLARRPSVVTLHGLHLIRRVNGARREAAALNLRIALRAADQTICVSESEHAELTRAVGADAARRAVVIRNGVRIPSPPDPSERVRLRTSLDVSPEDVVAIWVGSLDDRKNPFAAVRGAEEAGVTLLVVGDGPHYAELARTSSRWVRILGHRDDVSRLLAASDLFVLTSQREGLAFSLLEAMAHGLVPVVTDLPENHEAIGDAGIAIQADDGSLASALRRLATKSDERGHLAGLARRRVATLFSATDMERRTHALYDDVLIERRRPALRSAAS